MRFKICLMPFLPYHFLWDFADHLSVDATVSLREENKLNQFQLFIIRAILGLFVAVVITRIFTGVIHVPYILGLAVILVGLAYFSEYLRQRRNR
jgi:uncharacterized membrane protein HdeD (DUF308 family)